MPTYNIRGINVDFPFEAYDCQLVYMEKVIQSLQNKCNALLESPTGTGKTLCLLCATLAWRKSLGAFSTGQNMGSSPLDVSLSQSKANNLPTIVYTSRTHSQLQQVIRELKRTNYRPKMVVLGSREQLCIHDQVSLLHGSAQTNACHSLCKRHTKHYCTHYNRVADFLKKNPYLGDEPIDIEEMVNIGRSCGPCPYYVSRELHKVVDILFAPYNYLIDYSYRKSLNLTWDNSILIFDEAHNLESLCSDAASFDLPYGLLTSCISEAKKCIDLSIARREMEKSNDKSHKPDNYAILRALLLKLEKRISEVPIGSKELGFTKPGPYIYELLGDLNITHETASMLNDIIEEAALLLEEGTNDGKMPQKMRGTICRLESISDMLKLIFKGGCNAHSRYYRVHVQEVEANAGDVYKGKASRTLSWWCFNPGFAMEEFARLGVGSIILTSGTLSPMDSFAQELKLKFPIRLENPHVVSANQIWAGVVPAGPSGCSFNSSYRTRDSLEYKQELGNAIVNFARIVPDGLLVFFPSYYLMDQCIGCWKSCTNSINSSTIWERICKHKQPVVEPRQSSLFPLSIEDYKTKLKDTSTSGAVFFAVCRGKVSEGLDFADHAGRAVIITGMPFAMRTDPKVRLKREYLDEQAQSQLTGHKVLTGEEWYNQQASRAVNQAVGRVIRHRNDYGAIIFCDERFALPSRQSQISLWIQPHIKCYSKFGDVVFTLTRFFRSGGIHGPIKLKSLQADSNIVTTPKPVLDGGISESPLEDVSLSSKPLNQAHGNVNEMKTGEPLDKNYLEKFFSSLAAPAKKDNSVKRLSSAPEIKRGNISSQMGEILPANRSSLTHCKQNQSSTLKRSNDLFCDVKKLPIPGVKNVRHINQEAIELTGTSLLHEDPSKEQLSIPCSLKKPKMLAIETDASQCSQNCHEQLSLVRKAQPSPLSSNPVKPEKLQISDNARSKQKADASSQMLFEDDISVQERNPVFSCQKNKDVVSDLVSCCDEETRGSTFLIQVKEKLTTAEYQEFVGFMKALKSKAMKIGQVLQCIARLFSAPERLPLLKRFKDYVPAKYHPLYEHHLIANERMVGSGCKEILPS
ncbi:regulator of telomere elongation helicase 1 homolog isoform X2 [Malania oleifera]|uniref:regulator of telomere elongation helicase 1 homolog isoform X2 n=1 Tax=Malania oleifera TaxID=397392 RepID=UPI0025ADAB8C|nr:regulator of telomere elongation helicase 1 homolog isoform X2 [Malania oleifera]